MVASASASVSPTTRTVLLLYVNVRSPGRTQATNMVRPRIRETNLNGGIIWSFGGCRHPCQVCSSGFGHDKHEVPATRLFSREARGLDAPLITVDHITNLRVPARGADLLQTNAEPLVFGLLGNERLLFRRRLGLVSPFKKTPDRPSGACDKEACAFASH